MDAIADCVFLDCGHMVSSDRTKELLKIIYIIIKLWYKISLVGLIIILDDLE
jgi:hypothetical protein